MQRYTAHGMAISFFKKFLNCINKYIVVQRRNRVLSCNVNDNDNINDIMGEDWGDDDDDFLCSVDWYVRNLNYRLGETNFAFPQSLRQRITYIFMILQGCPGRAVAVACGGMCANDRW